MGHAPDIYLFASRTSCPAGGTPMQNTRSRSAMALCALWLAIPAHSQPPTFDPFEATIPQILSALSSGSITCRQLVQFYFNRMDALDIAGPKLNAVRARNAQALTIADAMD